MYMGVAPYRATPIYDKYLNLVEPLKGGMRQVFSIISCRKFNEKTVDLSDWGFPSLLCFGELLA